MKSPIQLNKNKKEKESFIAVSILRDLPSLTFNNQNEKENLGATWARFLLLVKSDPVLSILNPLVLHKFYKSLDKDSSNYLDFITGRVSCWCLTSKPTEGYPRRGWF